MKLIKTQYDSLALFIIEKQAQELNFILMDKSY